MGGFEVRQPGLVLMAFVVGLGPAQTARVEQAQTADERRPKIDVDSYTIEAQINPETQTITARASVRFIPLDDQITNAVFELNNNLNISRTVDEKGQPIGVTRNQQDNSV